jgi:hypothetical protein
VVFERLFGGLESTDPAVERPVYAGGEHPRPVRRSRSPSAERWAARSGQARREHCRIRARNRAAPPERRGPGSRDLPVVESPAGFRSVGEEHAKLMFDLQALAFQTDMTRIITFLCRNRAATRTRRSSPGNAPFDFASRQR